jgi:hypothetical protein
MKKQSEITFFVLFMITVGSGILVFTSSSGSDQRYLSGPLSEYQIKDNPADRKVTTLNEINKAFVDIASAANPTVITVFTE